MIDLTAEVRKWPVVDDWSIAPAGLSWVTAGARLRVGTDCQIGADCRLGDGCRLGDNAADPIDLGVTDDFRKCLAFVDGVPYIGAGCRWFTLDAAIQHWTNHSEDRRATRAQMAYAQALVALRGGAK